MSQDSQDGLSPETPNIDYSAQYRKAQEQSLARLKKNRKPILQTLRGLKATHVVVSYSGSGDSGAVESVDVYRDQERISKNPEVAILITSSHWNPKLPGWEERGEIKRLALGEALTDFVYDWLAREHSGWENNDGGSGECTINVDSERFQLAHNSYYTESDYTETEL